MKAENQLMNRVLALNLRHGYPQSNSRVFISEEKRPQCVENAMDEIHARD